MNNDPPFMIILIMGNQDFTYLVLILTLKQYHIIIIVSANHYRSLTYQASAVLDWNIKILQIPSKAGLTLSNSILQPPSLPNTFPPSSLTQIPDIVTSVPLIMLSDTLSPQIQWECIVMSVP